MHRHEASCQAILCYLEGATSAEKVGSASDTEVGGVGPAVEGGVEGSKGCREACSRLVRLCRSHTCRLPSLHTASRRHAPSLLRLTGGAGSFMAGNMRLPALVYTCV